MLLSQAGTHMQLHCRSRFNKFPEVPPPLTTYGLELEKTFFTPELLPEDAEVCVSPIGNHYRVIENIACPAFFQPSALKRLQQSFTARPDDVFLVFPGLSDSVVTTFASALVEQQPVDDVDKDFPRWLDAAVSRRGWQYVDALERWPTRRLLTTQLPPWSFPCCNIMPLRGPVSVQPGSVGEVIDASLAQPYQRQPKLAVFVGDPRLAMMKELACHSLATIFPSPLGQSTILTYIDEIAEAGVNNCSLVQMFGGSLLSSLFWARAEAQDPANVRLFFTEDFLLQPEVAFRGLANFCAVPRTSDVSESVFIEASTRMNTILRCHDQAGIVASFEQQIAQAPYGTRASWHSLVEQWLTSPNDRMVAIAECVLEHMSWNPAKWWASHSARLCRPCLFFPRGTCTNEACGFCHGPGHAKPKRPSKARRSRKQRFDHTPSPERSQRVIECDRP